MKVLNQKVDEAADLRREMVAMRVDRVDGVLGLQELGQDRNETTRFNLVDEQEARGQRESLAMHRRQPQRVVAVGLQISLDRDRLFAIGPREPPFVADRKSVV